MYGHYQQQNNVVVVRRGNLMDMILGLFFVWKSGLPRDAVFPDESYDWSESVLVKVLSAPRDDFSLLDIETLNVEQSCIVVPGLLIDQVLAQLTTIPAVLMFWLSEHGHAAFTEFDEGDLEEIRLASITETVTRRVLSGLGEDALPVNAIVGIVNFLMKDSAEPLPDWLIDLIDRSYSVRQRGNAAEISYLISRYIAQAGLPPDAIDPYDS
jgi:hypothetical protein